MFGLQRDTKATHTAASSAAVRTTPGAVQNQRPCPGRVEVAHDQWAMTAWEAFSRSLTRLPQLPVSSIRTADALFLERYTKRSREGTAIAWLKYHTSYIFAYAAAQDELPQAPGPFDLGERAGGIVGGRIGRAIHSAMVRGRGGNWACRRACYDIMMSKIGMPPAPDTFVQKSLLTHQQALTRHESALSPEDSDVLQQVKTMIGNICSVFHTKVFSHCNVVPSMNASFKSGRSDGGSLGELFSGFQPGGIQDLLEADRLFEMVDFKGRVKEARFKEGHIVDDFQDYVDSLWVDRILEPLDATPVPILEPLKVRIITKGDAAEYYRTVELQKFMHSTLRNLSPFEYIGHPIDDESWRECFGDGSLNPDQFFVSGDYKAATDNLRPDLSLLTWQCICAESQIFWGGSLRPLLETPYYFLGRKALCGHKLHYKDGAVVDQTWGQLMGSPMSFPILCIVNLAATLVALGMDFSPSVPIKVNGDDIAFVANAESYATWKRVTAICGLEFSLGKNYTSRSFIIMNSQLRRPPRPGEIHEIVPGGFDGLPDDANDGWRQYISHLHKSRPWKLVGFLNQSLLYGKERKGVDAGQMKDVYWTDLESVSWSAIEGLPAADQAVVLRILLKQYRNVIRELPPRCNLWFPKVLGGAGFAIPDGFSVKDMVTRFPVSSEHLVKSQKVAAYLSCHHEVRCKGMVRSEPVYGEIGNCLKETLALSNKQVPPVLRPKPLVRNQKVQLGGRTLLGYLCRGLAGTRSQGDGLEKSTIGGLTDSLGERGHASRSQFLKNSYCNWVRKAQATSLHPMNLDSIGKYREHLQCTSYLESMHDHTEGRSLDSFYSGFWRV